MARLKWFLLATLVFGTPTATRGQGPQVPQSPRDYRALPYDGDLATILQEQIIEVKGMQGLEKLIEDIRKNPDKYADFLSNKEVLKGSTKLSPALRKQLEKAMAGQKDALKFEPGELKAMEEVLKKKVELEKSSSNGKATDKHAPVVKEPPKPQESESPDFRWELYHILKKADQSAWSRDYPAFSKFFEEMDEAGWLERNPNSPVSGAGVKDVLAGLLSKHNDENNSEIGLPEPGLLQVPHTGLESTAIPFVPSVAPGDLKGASAIEGGLTLLLIVLGVAGLGTAVAVAWRYLGPRPLIANVPATLLGPWPVDPARIASRRQLIQAFEYLALTLLGPTARSTNHRDIADNLGATPEREQAADELAALYEQARYDPLAGEPALPSLEAARRDLCLLAGLPLPAVGEG
jgi:hypothetical protein